MLMGLLRKFIRMNDEAFASLCFFFSSFLDENRWEKVEQMRNMMEKSRERFSPLAPRPRPCPQLYEAIYADRAQFVVTND
jgi:hypothetical protein